MSFVNFQKIDFHLSLATPFNNSPRMDVFNRAEKNIKRFNKISKYYHFTDVPTPEGTLRVKFASERLSHVAHGILAYAILLKHAEEYNPITDKEIIRTTLKLDKGQVQLDFPFDGTSIELAFIGEPEKAEIAEVYNPILGIQPRRCVLKNGLTFYNIHHVRIIIAELYISGQFFRVVNVQYLLQYFLSKYFISKSVSWLKYYTSLLAILTHVEKCVKNLNDVEKILINSPFFMSSIEYGRTNKTESEIIMTTQIEENIGIETKPAKYADNLPQRGFTFTEKSIDKIPQFDYKSYYFDIDGAKSSPTSNEIFDIPNIFENIK